MKFFLNKHPASVRKFLFNCERLRNGLTTFSLKIKISEQMLVKIILLIGIILRGVEYFENHSLWLDEAVTAYKVTSFHLQELVQLNNSSFHNMHAYPIGFLFIEQLAIKLFGNNELVLRLYPFVCGILSLFIFAKISLKILKEKLAALALGIFAISRHLIYYSIETKPYSSDVLFCLLLIWCFLELIKNPGQDDRQKHYTPAPKLKETLYLTGIGILAIYCSFPAMIVMAGIGIALFIYFIAQKKWTKINQLILPGLCWIICFSAYYFLSLKYFYQDTRLYTAFNSEFMPLQADISGRLLWLLGSFKKFLTSMLDLPFILSGIIFAIGATHIYNKRIHTFMILSMPILLTILLSIFKFYPFGGRTTTFLAPIFILFIAAGVERINQYKTVRSYKIIPTIVVLLLLLNPLLSSAKQSLDTIGREDTRSVIKYLKSHQQEGDALYLNVLSQYPYIYYVAYFDFDFRIQPVGKFSDIADYNEEVPYILAKKELYNFHPDGTFAGAEIIQDTTKIYKNTPGMFGRNKRTWILLSHTRQPIQDFVLDSLNSQGKKITEFKQRGASLYLYDLNLE